MPGYRNLPLLHRMSKLAACLMVVNVFFWLAVAVRPSFSSEPSADLPGYRERIQPILAKYCVECHGPVQQKGNFRLDVLDPDILRGKTPNAWQEVLDKTQLVEMPPPKHAKQPSETERQTLIAWLRKELTTAAKLRASTGGRGSLRRLTRDEYIQTMRDLLGVAWVDFGEGVPTEPRNRDTGFDNDSALLPITETHLKNFLSRARAGLAEALVTGPRPPSMKATLRPKSGAATAGPFNRGKGDDNLDMAITFDPPREKRDEHGREWKLHSPVTVENDSFRLDRRIERDHGYRSATIDHNGSLIWYTCLSPPRSPGETRIRLRVSGKSEGEEAAHVRVDLGLYHMNKSVHQVVGQALVPSAKPVDVEFCIPSQNVLPAKTAEQHQAWVLWVRHTEPDLIVDHQVKDRPTPKGKAVSKPVLYVHEVTIETPVNETWPPARHIAIVGENPVDEPDCIRGILTRFMRKAWRRPPTPTEVDAYYGYYKRLRANYPGMIETLRETLAGVLVSPHFFYLAEPIQDGAPRQPLNAHALAARLSYAFWGTFPDAELNAKADSGSLLKADVLRREVDRLLADPRSDRFTHGFADSWLGLDGIDAVNINPEFYPDQDELELKRSMRGEARHFFATVLKRNLPPIKLIDADFVCVDRRLSRHYGLPLVPGNEFVAVPAAPPHKPGGVLNLAAVHLLNSTGEHSHPIRRGVWVRRRLLNDPPGDPPPAVPSVAEDQEGLSLTKRLAAHRNVRGCADCHAGIDPWGMPFESFDAIGKLRNHVATRTFEPDMSGRNHVVWHKKPVESSAQLPDGAEIADLEALRNYLSAKGSERFTKALTQRLASYLLRRTMEFADEPALSALQADWRKADGGLRDLVIALSTSELFRTR